jgi:hypothetical protein
MTINPYGAGLLISDQYCLDYYLTLRRALSYVTGGRFSDVPYSIL